MTVTILKSEPERNRQTVQLNLDIDAYSNDTELTVAHFGGSYVNLARLNENLARDEWGKIVEPEKIALSVEEMDALAEAWTAFKADIAAREQAKAERIAAQYAEALALAASVKTDVPALDIKITQNPTYPDRFVVEVPEFSFYDSVYDLVDTVERAIARIEQNIARMERTTVSNPKYVTKEEQAQVIAWRAVRPLVPAAADCC